MNRLVRPALFLTIGLLVGSFLAVLLTTTAVDAEELSRLKAAYGEERNSQGVEEWIVRDFFKDRRGGVFVDIGAADYRDASNTWYLESRLGWSGIAVDAQEIYKNGYERNRPRTRFFSLFVSDRSNDKARLFLSNASNWVASKDQQFTAQFGRPGSTVDVPTITMNDLLTASRVERFEFLSMDIELSEPEALAGFDIDRFRPELVCIEAHPQVRQQILNYFADHNYRVVGRYLRVDERNLWFSRD
jgi:FkbM family methyltransferase